MVFGKGNCIIAWFKLVLFNKIKQNRFFFVPVLYGNNATLS